MTFPPPTYHLFLPLLSPSPSSSPSFDEVKETSPPPRATPVTVLPFTSAAGSESLFYSFFGFFFSYSRLLVFVFICSITAALSGLLVCGYTYTSHDLGGVNQEEGIEENIKGVIWTRKPQPRLIPLPDTYRRLPSP